MRTTVDLPDELLRELKTRAAREGRTLSAVLTDAARLLSVREPGAVYAAPPLPISRVAGRGLQPGVDLDDSGALLDLMSGTAP